MSLKPTVITNLSYKRVGQGKQFRDLAKYLQYRDGSVRREAYLRGEGYGGPERSDRVGLTHREAKWVDRGMGESYKQITKRAHELKGRSVLARTWVISPDPDLMVHIPEEQRLEVMQRLTEQTVEFWYDDNEWSTPEYSYVIHVRQTNDKGRQQLHAHVVTPGTIPLDPDLGRIDHVVKRPHIRDLHETAEEVFQGELVRVLGRERAQDIFHEREQRLLAERYPQRHRNGMQRQFGQMMALASLLRTQKARRRNQDRELRRYVRYLRHEARVDREKAWAERRAHWTAEHRADLEQARLEEAERQTRILHQRQQCEMSETREREHGKGLSRGLDLEL